MKRVAILLFIIIGIAGLFFLQKKEQKKQVLPASDSIVAAPTKILRSAQNDNKKGQNDTSKKFLFVPYWGQTQERIPNAYGDAFIYFGITPNKDGIDKEEDGYMGLARFEAISKGRETLLTLRMIDSDISFPILKDQNLQKKIIEETITITKKFGFSGIVLDLEINSLPFASVTDQMNSFVKEFSESAKKNNLSFSMMFYGDTFYRLRPYDVMILRQFVDMLFVMAYDFSKARLDPGPNFPLNGEETYGYDFKLMVNDFLNIVPREKIVIVFGMFGYNWKVDSQNKSVEQAQARTLTVAKKQFVDQCIFTNCVVKRDETSTETTVTYIDKEGNKHIVWFEDEESVAKKMEFLQEKGINSVGYWAYSYF